MSTLKVDTLQTTGGAGLYPARAWVNFNGTGTVAINGSESVSSIADNGTGLYTVSMSNAMTTASFCYALSGQSNNPAHLMIDVSQRYNTNNTTSNLYLGTGENGGNGSTGRNQDSFKVSATVIE